MQNGNPSTEGTQRHSCTSHTQIVQISHTLEQRADELGRLHFREARSANNALKQLAALKITRDERESVCVKTLHKNV